MPETSKILTQQQFHEKLAVFLTNGPRMLDAHNALQFHDAEQREELKRTKAALEIAEKAIQDAAHAKGCEKAIDHGPQCPDCRRTVCSCFKSALARIERAKETGEINAGR